MYYVETIDYFGYWSRDVTGEFPYPTLEEAEACIAQLKQRGDNWAISAYRVIGPVTAQPESQ